MFPNCLIVRDEKDKNAPGLSNPRPSQYFSTLGDSHHWFTELLIHSAAYHYDTLTDCATGAGWCQEWYFFTFDGITKLKSKLTGRFHYATDTQSETSGQSETQGKWNRISWLNQANREEWLLPYFISFLDSYARETNWLVKMQRQTLAQPVQSTSRGGPE